MSVIYALKLENDKYYVGKTSNLDARFKEHKSGTASTWTGIHPLVRIVEAVEERSEFDELSKTLEYMKKYGIDNCRGSIFTQEELSKNDKEFIVKIIYGASNKCYKCGSTEHFLSECEGENKSVWSSLFETVTGFLSIFSEAESEPGSQRVKQEPKFGPPASRTCYRCGRKGHYSSVCFARTHINGYTLR